MMTKLVCASGLLVVGIVGLAPLPGERQAEKSPHAAALELVFEKAAARIRAIDKENWWHDLEERAWSARRPFSPGFIDSTHMFTVTYRVAGKQAASWQVDTRRQTVEEIVQR